MDINEKKLVCWTVNSDGCGYLCSREPGRAVKVALDDLWRIDRYLLDVDANERSITHRLAVHLQAKLRDWSVDCEFNRDGIDPKRLQHMKLYPDQEDTDAQTVYPDIVVHRRGRGADNYLVIEIKKSTSQVDRQTDLNKLQGYKKQLGYLHALFLELGTGNDAGMFRAVWV